MIATQQIETSELAERDFKVLILPYSIALSAAETDAIASFAGNGGMVVADMQTGIMDEHCKLHASGSLDGLFGIERFGHRTRPFSGDDCIKPVEGFEYPALNEELLLEQEVTFPIAEPGVRLTSGKAAFVDDFMRKMPVIAINSCGKMRFGISLSTEKPDGEYCNVLSINLYNPDGVFQRIYSENVAVPGHECIKEHLLPCNEATGFWKISVTDAATGISNHKAFMVE